ncbi:MAG: MmgE/PrpD family protein [Capsulimonadaceae bacterium]
MKSNCLVCGEIFEIERDQGQVIEIDYVQRYVCHRNWPGFHVGADLQRRVMEAERSAQRQSEQTGASTEFNKSPRETNEPAIAERFADYASTTCIVCGETFEIERDKGQVIEVDYARRYICHHDWPGFTAGAELQRRVMESDRPARETGLRQTERRSAQTEYNKSPRDANEPTLAERFADYAYELKYEDLPTDTVHEVKRRLLDTLGCALGAFHAEPARIARIIAQTVRGTNPATVIGTTIQTSPEMAAFANGILFRYLDYNDTYLSKEPAHPSDNLAAVLAAAEASGADGRGVITATVLAYEVQCRLCDAASIRKHGWDHVTYGAFSTSLAAAKLLGLKPKQIVQALALAGTPNVALRQTRVGMLSHWKGCAFANTSRNGVFAAILAKHGLTGPSEVFEGPMGFFNQVSGPFDIEHMGGDGTPFMINKTYIKKHPAEYHSQSAIDAALDLHAYLPNIDDIVAVSIETFNAALEIIGGEPEKWHPTTRETADHSLPYCVAVALTEGKLTQDSFDASHLCDEQILGLIERIEVMANSEMDARYPAGIPNLIRVRTIEGDTLEKEVTYPRGHSANPMEDIEVEEKFRALADPVLPRNRVDEVIARCWSLDRETSIASLLRLLVVKD